MRVAPRSLKERQEACAARNLSALSDGACQDSAPSRTPAPGPVPFPGPPAADAATSHSGLPKGLRTRVCGRRFFRVPFPFSPKPRCIWGLSLGVRAQLTCVCDPKECSRVREGDRPAHGLPAGPTLAQPQLGHRPHAAWTCVRDAGPHLGGDVVRGAAEGLGGDAVPHVLLAHAEVGDLHVALGVQHHVVELQVAVGDARV